MVLLASFTLAVESIDTIIEDACGRPLVAGMVSRVVCWDHHSGGVIRLPRGWWWISM